MAIWLFVCCAMIFLMVVIGGVTRLTESGLSITEWRPIAGIVPPLSAGDWQRQFELYQRIPEFREVNPTMTLAEFKTIFFWEYLHRLWGRLIGVVFAVPFLYFLIRGRIRRTLIPHFAAMLVLGGLQGLLGWFMVRSGLSLRVDVSQYRLAAHLLVALAIYGYVFWVACSLLGPAGAPADSGGLRSHLLLLSAMTIATIVMGAFVAGLDAGLIYNSFPLMGGRFVPTEIAHLRPLWLNLFENPATAQFVHRWLAILTVALALAAGLRAWRGRQSAGPALAAAAAASLQAGLGIATLLLQVPIALAVLHQAGAVLLWTTVLWALHRLSGHRLSGHRLPRSTEPGATARPGPPFPH